MQAAYKASFEVYNEFAATNPRFKKVFESWKAFRDEEFLWFRVCENPYENFVYAQAAAEAKTK